MKMPLPALLTLALLAASGSLLAATDDPLADSDAPLADADDPLADPDPEAGQDLLSNWYEIDVIIFTPTAPEMLGEGWLETAPEFPAGIIALSPGGEPRPINLSQLVQLNSADALDPKMLTEPPVDPELTWSWMEDAEALLYGWQFRWGEYKNETAPSEPPLGAEAGQEEAAASGQPPGTEAGQEETAASGQPPGTEAGQEETAASGPPPGTEAGQEEAAASEPPLSAEADQDEAIASGEPQGAEAVDGTAPDREGVASGPLVAPAPPTDTEQPEEQAATQGAAEQNVEPPISPIYSEDYQKAAALAFTAKQGSVEMTDMAQRLEISPGFDVQLHQSWIQPLGRKPIAVQFQAGEQHGDFYQIEGSISFSLQRLVRVATRLWFTQFQSASGRYKKRSGADFKSLDRATLVANRDLVAIEAARGDTMPGRRYLMEQSRRLRSNETHYIDHPLFGVIVRVNRYTP